MKKLVLFLLAVLLIITFGFSEDLVKKEFKVKPGNKLNVDLKTGGSIQISGWDRKLAKVHAYSSKSSEYYDVICEQNDEGIRLETRFKHSRGKRNGGVDVEVNLPKKFDLVIRTMGGSVIIENINGNISGKTMGGALELSDLGGEIYFTTMGGRITLKDSDIDGKLKTMGGRVLLENVVGDIKGSSMGGNVVYKNVRSRGGSSTGKVVKISTMGGAINVENAANGADVHTMGGKIYIKSAKQFVKAKTMGGRITIEEIDGWVSATTMGGDIEVTMIGNSEEGKRDVKLVSMGGDIELTVPAKLHMDVDLELAFTKRSVKNYKIITDFDINIKKTKEWQYEKGNYRKYIYGKGKIGTGKHKIMIKTVNGNIYLKKGK